MIKINRKFGRMAMKKCLILISLFFVILLSASLLPAETDNPHLILGVRIPAHVNVRKDSPTIPIKGLGAGIGIGFYTEVLPFPYISFESGLYVRTFTLGRDISYQEMHVPIVAKLRYPFSDVFAMSIGGGLSYCKSFRGKTASVIEDADPIPLPDGDLISDWGYIIKIGFQWRAKDIIINLDLGFEHVDKPTNIVQTDFVLGFGMGYGLF